MDNKSNIEMFASSYPITDAYSTKDKIESRKILDVTEPSSISKLSNTPNISNIPNIPNTIGTSTLANVDTLMNEYKNNPSKPLQQNNTYFNYRTPLNEVIEPVNAYDSYTLPNYSVKSKESFWEANNQHITKFFIISLIVFFGSFMYSSFMYTLSDRIFSKYDIQLFSVKGEPSFVIIVIHSLIFFILIYLIFNTFKIE